MVIQSSRHEKQKGVSDIFGEMDIYSIYIYIYIYIYKMKALNELFLLAKVLSSMSVQFFYYKQLKSVNKVKQKF